MRYQKHYTREEARAILPQVRRWLKQLVELREDLHEHDTRLEQAMSEGCDVGGEIANDWVRLMANVRSLLAEFSNREIQIKDLDRGLIDFPAVLEGKEVFLCWENGEKDIGFWHDLDAGYAGREEIEEG